MPINTTNFQSVLTTVANALTTANTPAQYQQIEAAIDTINNRITYATYANVASLPLATTWQGSYVYTLSEDKLWFSNGVAWSAAGQIPVTIVNDVSNTSTTTAASSSSANILQTLVNTAFLMAEQQSTGALFGAGNNGSGNLGLGNVTNYSSPVQSAGTSWKQLAYNTATGIGIRGDGTLWSWGIGTAGVLGQGATTTLSSPVQIGANTTWKQAAVASYAAAAIKNDNTLWTWGQSNTGQAGTGSFTNISSPVQVGTATNWRQVACGYVGPGEMMAAIKTDGTLWTWGYNANGQLGLGTLTQVSTPVQVGTATNWRTVYCGYTGAAIKADGTLWTWGFNGMGQLGLGTTTQVSTPVQVGNLTNWLSVSAGGNQSIGSCFTVATKTDGTLWSWGANGNGQLGLGNTTSYSSPVQVGTLNTWRAVVAGNSTYSYGNNTVMVYATKTDGTLWVWGNNQYGQLGLGNTTSYSSPVQVGTLTNWKQIASGGSGASGFASSFMGITYPVSSGTFQSTIGNITGSY